MTRSPSMKFPRGGLRPAGLLALAMPLLLSACGGGGSAGTPLGDPPTVSSVTVTATQYGQTAQVAVTGTNLNGTVTLAPRTCRNVSRLAGTDSQHATLYCTITGALNSTVDVVNVNSGAVLGSGTYTVAAPEVTMAVSNGGSVNGNLVFSLDPTRAPITVDNFLDYVNSGFYAGTIFHRVVPGFVIQAGGYTSDGALKTTNAPIALETNVGLHNTQWTLAMARGGAAASATSQFYVNVVDNLGLDWQSSAAPGYAVFGSLSAGTAVAQAIVVAPPCGGLANGSECKPTTPIVITGAVQTK